jgi:hypothetical protein
MTVLHYPRRVCRVGTHAAITNPESESVSESESSEVEVEAEAWAAFGMGMMTTIQYIQ